jgi:hypothetical protein
MTPAEFPSFTSGAHPASYPMGTRGSFSRGKAVGAWSWPSPPSSAEVKEWVELYLHSPSTPSWRGVWLSTGTILPLLLQEIQWQHVDETTCRWQPFSCSAWLERNRCACANFAYMLMALRGSLRYSCPILRNLSVLISFGTTYVGCKYVL